ncbi:Equilibrative nucleoside transporter 3 [Melipona quadrifasciata]|uniref:Equilibrative nucleoside transporter 3 n=1 Tax=Melipona quadrifasciata TaxID=166423 RepID=A0A0M8ZX87_9HYME|nr:Equilibrative nucleoside transporter 3 [Melipona quadrifasciata]
MSYSINRRPLLERISDSEFEDDLETEVDDPNISVPDEKPFLKQYEPSDKYNLAYIVFYVLGINTLIPWSFFITADDYWIHVENLEKITDLQASVTSYISVASALPNTFFLILNAFISKRISLRVRMVGSQWQGTFLIITLTTVACVNAASAIFGGSLMGIVGRFSPKYITAMSSGQALGGIITATAEICSLWIGASPVLSGLIYFIIGDVILFLSLIAYIILEKTVNYSITGEVTFPQGTTISYTRIIKRIWHYGINVFLVFCISFSVYPALTVLVKSQCKGKGYAWNDIYFVPVVTYLIFSCGDYTGRILSGIFQWSKNKPWQVVLLSLMRVIFIPAFIFCNAQPRHHLSVYIHSDLYYILITIAFAISNGYLCNLSFILTPAFLNRVVDSQEKEIASIMIGAFLGMGLISGSALSLFVVKAL